MTTVTSLNKTEMGVLIGSNPVKYARMITSENKGNRKSEYPMTMDVVSQVVSKTMTEYTTWNSSFNRWDSTVVNAYSPVHWSYGSVTVSSFPTTSINFIAQASDIALGRLLSNLKSENWSASLFIAESAESFRMIANASTRLYAAMKALKRGRLGDVYRALGTTSEQKGGAGKRRYPPAKQVRENLASYWLETKLGWVPLLQDLHDGADKIAKLIYGPTKLPICEVTGTGSYWPADRLTYSNDADSYRNRTVTILRQRTQVKYIVRYTVSNQMIATAQGLGLTNPMSLFWETIPLSFVLDYIIPIGDWLESLTAYQGLTFHSGCRVSKVKEDEYNTQTSKGRIVSRLGSIPGVGYTATEFTTKSGTSSTISKYGQRRSVLTSFPSPRPPKFGYSLATNNRDVQRAGTILALIKQFRF
jgi:hypothetical protein